MSAKIQTVAIEAPEFDRRVSVKRPVPCLEHRFSTRENQILHLLLAGFTGREIGICLKLCPRTVEMYRVLINRKLDEHDSF